MYTIEYILYGLILYGSCILCCKKNTNDQLVIITEQSNLKIIDTPPAYIQNEDNPPVYT